MRLTSFPAPSTRATSVTHTQMDLRMTSTSMAISMQNRRVERQLERRRHHMKSRLDRVVFRPIPSLLLKTLADHSVQLFRYNILLSIFYVPFVLSGPGMNMLTKRFGAKYILPIAMLIFGSMAMLSAACTSFGGIVTTRWFLGMAESGFYAGVIFYLSTFYTRSELAGRLSIYYAASEIAGKSHSRKDIRDIG